MLEKHTKTLNSASRYHNDKDCNDVLWILTVHWEWSDVMLAWLYSHATSSTNARMLHLF